MLIKNGGYKKGSPKSYDSELALFPDDIIAFVQKTQPEIWSRITKLDAEKTSSLLIDSLTKELNAKGSLAVLREGFKCVGKTLHLAYFAPNTGLDPSAATKFKANRLTITRQIKTKTGAIPDIVLSVNGLPVANRVKKPHLCNWLDSRKRQISVLP